MKIININNKFNYKQNIKLIKTGTFILISTLLVGCGKVSSETYTIENSNAQTSITCEIDTIEETNLTAPEILGGAGVDILLNPSLYDEDTINSVIPPIEDDVIEEDTRKVVALTFDDGPGKYTDKLLDILEANNCHATFFVVGTSITENTSDIVIKAYNNGNEIAVHCYNQEAHKINYNNMTNEEILEGIEKTRNKIEELGISPSMLVRAPGGNINTSKLEELDIPFIYWSVDTRDWEKPRTTEKIKANIDSELYEGGIILMHDTHSTSVDALEELLPELIKEYKFVTVSELFNYYENEFDNNGKQYRKVYINEK